MDAGDGNAEFLQKVRRISVPDGDDANTAIENTRRQLSVALSPDGTDSAAVEHYAAAGMGGQPENEKIIPEGTGAGYILQQRTSATEEEIGTAQ